MNRVIQLGRLTKDVELNYAAGSGTAIARFSIAVPRARKRDEADFHNCVAFGKTAETISTYYKKGQRILIEGELRSGSYDAKDGTKRYTSDIIVNRFEFVDSAKQNNDLTGDIINEDPLNDTQFEPDLTPVDDGDMPF